MKSLEPYKAILSYFSFSMAGSLLGFLGSLVMVRFMSPEEFGRYAIFNSILFFSAPLISISADGLIGVKKTKLTEPEYLEFRTAYVTYVYMIWLVLQSCILVLWYVGVVPSGLYVLIPLCGLVRFLTTAATTEYVLEGKATQYGVIAFINSLAALILTWALLRFYAGTADSRILALLASEFIFLAVRYHGRINLLFSVVYNKQIIGEVSKFGFPLLLSIIPAWALLESDKIIVAKFLDLESAGYYAAACTIAGVVETFNRAVLNAVIPHIYRDLSDPQVNVLLIARKYMKRFLLLSIAFSLSYSLLYALLSDYILPVRYVLARPIVYVAVAFALGNGLYRIIGLVIDYYSMTVAKLFGIIFGGCATIAFSILGVIQFGVIGAAIGVGTGYVVLSTILWFVLVNRFGRLRASRNS